MNHLAHLFLAQSDVNLLVGNFIADHVKGKEIQNYSLEIQQGIAMHRAIDHFTDHHPLVVQSKKRLYPKYHKYSAVIIDMFYDHILAKNWKDYSPITLEQFSQSVYKVLEAQSSLFNKRSQNTLHYMKQQDWLSNYAHLGGMEKALSGLAYRAKFDSKMDESVRDLESEYHLYEEEFKPFFKELYEFSLSWQHNFR